MLFATTDILGLVFSVVFLSTGLLFFGMLIYEAIKTKGYSRCFHCGGEEEINEYGFVTCKKCNRSWY